MNALDNASRGEAAREPDLVFLLYYSRSGSTFLASRLNRFRSVGVTVESNFMRALILNQKAIFNAASAREVYSIIENKGRIPNLGLTVEGFSEHLREGGGYTIEEVTRAILGAYFFDKKPGCRTWVIKDGANGYWIDRISSEIPSARFIHVVRDGRAVLNSTFNTTRPYGEGEKMARDPLTLARLWTKLVRRVDDYAAANPGRCIQIRYEKLISDEEEQIARIGEFLGLGEGTMMEGEDYHEKIPDKEKAVHKLISSPGVPKRVNAWKRELSRGNLLVFEYRAAGTLEKYGYEVSRTKFSQLIFDKDFVRTVCISVALRVWDWGGLIRNPEKLRYALRTKILHWGGGT